MGCHIHVRAWRVIVITGRQPLTICLFESTTAAMFCNGQNSITVLLIGRLTGGMALIGFMPQKLR